MNNLSGYSFSPGLANRFRSSLNNPTGAGQLPANVGQALQVLSLHLPSFIGGAPIAPDELLRPSHSFTPDLAVRQQTTGMASTPPASAAPAPTAGASPAMSAGPSPALSVFQPGGAGGQAPAAPAPAAPPPNPTFGFGAPPPNPTFGFGNGSSAWAPPNNDASGGLIDLLNGFLRGPGTGGFGGGSDGGNFHTM